jgi:serine/threonine protein kinase/WD40 repeat protein
LVSHQAGEVIDRYTITRPVGDGGFSEVFLAEQQVPIRRRVALKILKPGNDSRRIVSRFRLERQTLARLSHPGIAPIYDAGTTGSGEPYFVMEYFEGLPLTRFCDERQWTLEQRFNLFLKLCEAVQHAHHRGIIHRDLKPGNILAQLNDQGGGEIRVIDFGIAKPLEEGIMERSIMTRESQFLGTPLYASPEQIDGRLADIDLRTDVFSLGVILYELIVGVPPLDPEKIEMASFTETHRMVCDVPPVPPVKRLALLPPDFRETLAENRDLSSERHGKALDGDLSWIVLQALERKPADRYDSVAALQADVSAYLSSQPIAARPHDAAYLAGRFVKRHRVAVLTSLGVFLSILAALVVSVVMAVKASRSDQQSRVSLEKAIAQQEIMEAALYRARVRAANQNIERQQLRGLHQILTETTPDRKAGQTDQRGWEWFYLNSHRFQYDREFGLKARKPGRMDLSGDGRTLAVTTFAPKGIALVDVASGKITKTWSIPDLTARALVDWHPRRLDRLLVAIPGHGVDLYDPLKGTILESAPYPGCPKIDAGYSFDGSFIAVATATAGIEIRDASLRKSLNLSAAFRPDAAISWAKRSNRLLWSKGDHYFEIHDISLKDGTLIGTPVPTLRSFCAEELMMRWSHDDRLLLSKQAETMFFYEVEAQKMHWASLGHALVVSQCEWHPKEDTWALGQADGSVEIWSNPASRHLVARLGGQSSPIKNLFWDPDGTTLFVLQQNGALWTWSGANSPEMPLHLPEGEAGFWINNVSWQGETNSLAVGIGGKKCYRFDLNQHAPGVVLADHDGADIAVAKWNRQGTFAATGGVDGVVKILAADGSLVASLQHEWNIDQVYWSPDGTRLATRFWRWGEILREERGESQLKCGITLWDTTDPANAKKLCYFRVPDLGNPTLKDLKYDEALGFAWHPSGEFFVTTTSSKQLRLRDKDGNLIKAAKSPHPSVPTFCSWSGDGKRLALGTNAGDLCVLAYNHFSFKLIHSRKIFPQPINAVAWNPMEERIAVTSEDNSVHVLDSKTLDETIILRISDSDEMAKVYALEWSPDGTRLAAANLRAEIKVWDAHRGYEQK